MDGIHLLGEWYECPAHTPEFTRAASLRALCLDSAREAGLTIVGDSFHQFAPQASPERCFSRIASRDPHVARIRLRDRRRVRLQPCHRQQREGEAPVPRAPVGDEPTRTKYQEIVRGGKDD
jgi:hypothetical protein